MKNFKRVIFIHRVENEFYTLWTKLDCDLKNLLTNQIKTDLSWKIEILDDLEIIFFGFTKL